MKFPYRELPHSGERRKRPHLRITVKNDDKECETWAIIDTGADHRACSAEIGEDVGIEIKSVEPKKSVTVDGKEVNVYFHDIRLKIDEWEIELKCGFIYGLDIMILGHIGFPDKFNVNFCYNENWFEIKRYKSSILKKVFSKIISSN